jgi:predicted nuclease of predicted toxin-antitoxin system
LIDEPVPDLLADAIASSAGVSSVEYIRDIRASAFQNAKKISDDKVVDHARRNGQIVVTVETGINHRSFPICTHPGILIIGGARRHDENRIAMFKNFMQSGERAKARDSVTFLTENKARIKTHTGDLPEIAL